MHAPVVGSFSVRLIWNLLISICFVMSFEPGFHISYITCSSLQKSVLGFDLQNRTIYGSTCHSPDTLGCWVSDPVRADV